MTPSSSPPIHADSRIRGVSLPYVVTIANNIISNSFNGVCVRDGDNLAGATVLVKENCLAGNSNAAIYNGGGVRAGIAQGQITLGDVLTAYPFPNTLVVLTLSGEDLRAALEHGVSAVGLHEGSGRFPQVAGIRYAYDPAQPAGKRITDVSVANAAGQYAPLAPKADYRLAISDYMARGGDSYSIFKTKGQDVDGDGDPLADLLARYITTHSPLSLKPDGRIGQ